MPWPPYAVVGHLSGRQGCGGAGAFRLAARRLLRAAP
jgi:hypothetical protein